jgi:hypothetical protein
MEVAPLLPPLAKDGSAQQVAAKVSEQSVVVHVPTVQFWHTPPSPHASPLVAAGQYGPNVSGTHNRHGPLHV